MERKDKDGSSFWGCFLVLVIGTFALASVVVSLKLPKATERQLLSGITTPLSSMMGFGLLLLLLALFRR